LELKPLPQSLTTPYFSYENKNGDNNGGGDNNNGGGTQLPDYDLKFEKNEYFLTVTADGVTPVDAPGTVVVFVDDQTGWAEGLALYQWGDVNNLGGGWPGAQVACTVNIAGTAYKVFVFEDAVGLNQNLIFNNNGNGTQLGDYALKLDEPQYFLTVTADGVTPKEAPNAAVIFANDQTGWDALALYQWGEVNNLGGDWPGAQVSATATVGAAGVRALEVTNAAATTTAATRRTTSTPTHTWVDRRHRVGAMSPMIALLIGGAAAQTPQVQGIARLWLTRVVT
jgi:hypothetical protein